MLLNYRGVVGDGRPLGHVSLTSPLPQPSRDWPTQTAIIYLDKTTKFYELYFYLDYQNY